MSTTASLLSGRRDILIVASVSCLYGIGNQLNFKKSNSNRKARLFLVQIITSIVQSLYSRTEADFNPGSFRIKKRHC
jgi:excinuclease ABC subunit B